MLFRPFIALATLVVFFTALAAPQLAMRQHSSQKQKRDQAIASLLRNPVGPVALRAAMPMLEQMAGSEMAGLPSFKPGTPWTYVQQEMLRLAAITGNLRFEIAGDRWPPQSSRKGVALTYSFPPDGTDITGFGFVNDGAVGDPNERMNHMHARWNALFGNEAAWKSLFRQAFDQIEAISGVIFTEVVDDGARWPDSPGPLNGGAVRGDIRMVSALHDGGGFGTVAFNFFPEFGGDMLLDSADVNTGWFANASNNFRILRNTIIHENGHGLGLDHACPQDSTKVMEPNINNEFDGPQLDDILGVQSLYGDRFEFGLGNDTEATATTMATTGFVFNGLPKIVFDLSLNAIADVDVFQIDVTTSSAVDATVTVIPTSGVYTTGPQTTNCDTGFSFNPATRVDLQLSIKDLTDLTTTTINSNALGLSETLTAVLQIGRSYLVTVTRAPATSFLGIQGYRIRAILTPRALAADISGDGCVDGADLAILLAQWGPIVGAPSDLNGDNVVNGTDLALFLASWSPC